MKTLHVFATLNVVQCWLLHQEKNFGEQKNKLSNLLPVHWGLKNHSKLSEQLNQKIQTRCQLCPKVIYMFKNFITLSIRGTWGIVDTFLHFHHCYFISSPNRLKLCCTVKQLYMHNIMPKHENNALQKKISNH